MTPEEKRGAFATALRGFADALERNQSIPVPWNPVFTLMNLREAETPEGLAGVVRDLGGTGWEHRTERGSGIDWLYVTADLGGGLKVSIQTRADKVSESVQTGVAPVYERKTPALDAVIAETRKGGAE